MNFQELIETRLQPRHLLQHPYYQRWEMGNLSREELAHYSLAYEPFVASFPRYVSAVHSKAERVQDRKLLLENLLEEEGVGQPDDHPGLWRRFQQAMGAAEQYGPASCQLDELFGRLCEKSFASGVGALLAYEYQNPEVCQTKVKSLIEKYGLSSPDALLFFKVHAQADLLHREQCLKLLEGLSEAELQECLHSFDEAAQGLWNFLTHLDERPAACA